MSQTLLVTLANRTFEGVDLQQLAGRLGLELVRAEGDSVAEIFNSGALFGDAKLIQGTGDYNFDGELAAALGVPVVLITATTPPHPWPSAAWRSLGRLSCRRLAVAMWRPSSPLQSTPSRS